MDILIEQKKPSKSDEWYTPVKAIEILVPFMKAKRFKKILCPFDTEESNFVQVFKRYSFEVIYSHIDTGTDFFNIEDFSNIDAIISNPPYSKRQAIIERLYEIRKPFAMLMNYNGLFDNRKRFVLFKNYGVEILVPSGRIAFFNNDHKAKTPMFQSVYVCNQMLNKQIEFAEMQDTQLTIFDKTED